MPKADELFKATFHDSPIGMAVIDRDGCYVDVNPAFCAIVARDRHSLIGSNFATLTHAGDIERDRELLDQLARQEFPYFQTQKRYARPDGSTVWARVTVVGVPDHASGENPHFVVQIEDVTEAREARERLESRALYDALTGLANRDLLLKRIQEADMQAAGTDHSYALVFVDLDHFKLVNDSLGHAAGDHLLGVIAQRIQGAIRREDTAARLGGDEFVVLLKNVASAEDAEARADILTRATQSPVTLTNHEVIPTVSAGIVYVDEEIGPEDLLRAADTAMYAAKQSGRASLKIYDRGLRDEVHGRLEIESELRSAIRNGELRTYYQKVVDLQQMRVAGYEALLRWHHPKRGVLSPADFLNVATQAGLILPMGKFVCHEVCRLISEHPEFDGQIFVNFSPRQIGTGNMAGTIETALKDTGVEANRLCVEITEAGVVAANQLARNDIDATTALGVDLAIDDFGTSYAALSSVVRFPISRIKLANEFTSRLGDDGFGDRISLAAAGLTRALGVTGIVEGIESEKQFARAQVHGWHLGQGYFFGEPVPESELDFERPAVDMLRDLASHT